MNNIVVAPAPVAGALYISISLAPTLLQISAVIDAENIDNLALAKAV